MNTFESLRAKITKTLCSNTTPERRVYVTSGFRGVRERHRPVRRGLLVESLTKALLVSTEKRVSTCVHASILERLKYWTAPGHCCFPMRWTNSWACLVPQKHLRGTGEHNTFDSGWDQQLWPRGDNMSTVKGSNTTLTREIVLMEKEFYQHHASEMVCSLRVGLRLQNSTARIGLPCSRFPCS